MDDERIKTFLVLTDTLNFTKAAAAVHKSQSVVSRQILSMENELGFQLFTRDSRLCFLTPGGQYFADGLRELVKSYDSLIENAKLINSGVSGTLNIGMHGGEVAGQYSHIINNFTDLYPSIAVTLKEYRLAELRERLSSGDIDIAFVVTDGPWYASNRDNFKYITSGIRWDCMYIHRTHKLFAVPDDKLRLTDFAGETFLVFTGFEPDIYHGPTSRLMDKLGIHPRLEPCDTLSSAVLRLESGKRVMISSSHLTITNSSEFRKIYFPELGKRSDAAAWSEENQNPCIGTFTSFLRKFIAKNPSILTYDAYYSAPAARSGDA